MFAKKRINMFTTAISLPGLAPSWLFAVEDGGSKEHKLELLLTGLVEICTDSLETTLLEV